MTHRYSVLLERGAEEDVWVAIVPALPGCVAQGASIEEAIARAQEAAAGYVEALLVLGERMPTESEPSIVATALRNVAPDQILPTAPRSAAVWIRYLAE